MFSTTSRSTIPASRRPWRRLGSSMAVGALAATALAATATPSTAAGTVTVSSQGQLVAAVARAVPGQTIALSAGTYSGGIQIMRSGTASAPITLRPAGNGPVVLTAKLHMPSCKATSPDPRRTVRIRKGASHWKIQDLTIRGGVYMIGSNSGDAKKWFAKRIDTQDWQARRAVPGRGANDPAAARTAVDYLERQTRKDLRPSDGIQIIGNTITGKGIHSAMNRYGTISGNTISDIACGTGPGIWLGNYSDGWTITGNTITRIAPSGIKHYMQEGIRIGGASNYNVVSRNRVSAMPAGSRAFTTDQDSSFNTFSRNTATGVDMGFNEQMSGWGNVWEYNTVTGYRANGFNFRGMDNKLAAPSKNSSSYDTVVRCNTATGKGPAMQAGGMADASFRANAFGTVSLSKNLRAYWARQGNTWNGSSSAPPERPASARSGC